MAKQKRSANTYQKINTLYKRDIDNIIMLHYEFVDPTITWLKDALWEASEKIDGTNIRIEVSSRILFDELKHKNVGVDFSVEYRGKTDNANVPKELMDWLHANLPKERVLSALGLEETIFEDSFAQHKWVDANMQPDYERIPKMYTIYGEGYGRKIQACGSRYIKDGVSFIGFDVKVDDLYLLKESRDDIMQKLGVMVVPSLGLMTISEAVEKAKVGFLSSIAEDKTLMAEGIVMKSPVGALNRCGDRLAFKIKTCDFMKYFNKYGTYDKVEQVPNPNIQK